MIPSASTARRPPQGFALVITLSLMVLLTIVAVGLLGLSSIALRSGGRDEMAAQARANARMALMLALGELQQQAGPDTRVTARADILDEKNPPVLGVWKSWEGTNHDSQGRPIAPRGYKSAKEQRFLAWLASGDPKTLPDTSARDDSVVLVGPRAVGEGGDRGKLQIHLEAEEIEDASGKGGFAWWISGENQKARLPSPEDTGDYETSDWAVAAKSHSTANPAPFRMDDLLGDPAPAAKAISLQGGDLIAEKQALKVSQEFFHDLSTTATGLLTNTATGGWRKDLSLVTENWGSLRSSSLPFFRQTPAKDIMFSKPTAADPAASKSMLYPWSAYRGDSSRIPIYRHGPVSSWENLVDYATTYKRVTSGASGKSRFSRGNASVAIDDTANTFNFLHRVRILPLVARVQWVFSHSAGPPKVTDPPPPAGSLEARLLLTPVITMWNPYNVEITAPVLTFSIPRPLPPALRYTVNGVANSNYRCLIAGATEYEPLSGTSTLVYTIPTEFPLKPGETRVFSPAANNVVAASGTPLALEQGYRGTGGHYFEVKNDTGQPVVASAGATIKADAKFDTVYNDGNPGVGIYLDMSRPVDGVTRRHLVYRMVYTKAVANEVYKPLTQLAESTLGAAQTTPAPFLSTVFGARMASKTHIPAKGFVQSSPLVNYTAMGAKDLIEITIQRHYGGTSHPVNSPFDYSFIKHAPGGDSQLPNASDTSGRGYIVTGFNKSDGLSRCVIAELPTRPLASLGELQNWDLRYENPIPPYAFNLIGNSDASPLLPPNAVVNSADASLPENLQHDDSYCANHLLFDDWFFSTIAPDPSSFGPTGGRTQQKTFTDFVSGIEPLDNRAYRPIEADARLAAADPKKADELFRNQVAKAEGYRSIASRIEVDGMFNVNSTSVTAWRALLGHARNQKVPHMQESGGGWSVDLSNEVDHPFSRFTIAGDVEASEQGSSGAFPEAAEFAGYRVLDEKVIAELAEKIVGQVRARGPFLSLAEFVNRQLSSGDLALAGAIQAALNELEKSPSSNPYKEIQATVGAAGQSVAVPVRAAEAEYKFPAAAAGYNAYGVPGWTRQADVLRPLAPILSARDDTFTIRAHGDARDKDGNIVSRAVCEAVVRRTREYVDPADAADITTLPKSPVNTAFGRRIEMVSFRWLSPSEI